MTEAHPSASTLPQARLSDDDRDDLYRRCCLAITEAGPSRESLYLARLTLLLMERLGDARACREAMAEALDGLREPTMSR